MVNFNVPSDVVFEILLRLPVMSLLRFKSVCKSWYSLIKNRSFAPKHLRHSNTNHRLTPILSVRESYSSSNFTFRQFSETSDKPVSFDLDLLRIMDGREILLGTCDGLLCIQQVTVKIVLYNPITIELRIIPPFKISKGKSDIEYFGFGLHSGSYILTRIIYTNTPSGKPIIKSELYSMSTNTWKEIRVVKSDLHWVSKSYLARWVVFSDMIPVLSFGVFYWKALRSRGDNSVFSFNISEGLFDEISAPLDGSESFWHLIELKEEFGLVTYQVPQPFDLWVLSVNKRTWTMKYRVEVDYMTAFSNLDWVCEDITVVGYERTGELVLKNRDSRRDAVKLLLYDPITKEIKFHPCNDPRWYDTVILFTPSLVSVEESNKA